MPKQSSIQLTESTARQVADLGAAGFGNLTAIVRQAIDRMWRDECGGNITGVEIWQRSATRERFAVLVAHGRPVAAFGALTSGEAASVMTGGTAFDWSGQLADTINAEDDAADEPVFRRVWPEAQP